MKYLRYGPIGQEQPGLLAPDGTLRTLVGLVPDIDGPSMASGALERAAEGWQELPLISGSPRLGPSVARVGKLLGVGLNYADHAAESGMPVPEQPILFFKATSCIVGPNDNVQMPPDSQSLDWEVELGIVIGREASNISVAQAREHIFGYLIVNDVSERDWQLKHSASQWTKGKSHDSFGPLGPWLVSREELTDPGNLDMSLSVNGGIMQKGNTRTMIFNVDQIVADISTYMRLEPGDVIATGTPPGVGMGMKPPRYLRRGDVMELTIQGLGTQRQLVV
ncbi:fumarylacetoacetate hydrolase family protein [Ottowia thiooxydans]|uniref:fumarylacetoacetate hydrolase family protein n=1 Tax=Ottowia thiooxydans TaxID=219182 RepID=UPI0003FFD364|nr:fumarylacetoacetate hydrolase family protein [Ottowia thiooxydans]